MGSAVAEDIDGRQTDVAPVSLSALHSDIKFNIVAPARKLADPVTLTLQHQALRILSGLQASATGLYPEAVARIGAFSVFIADSKEISVLSSATGRIALNAGFADLAPTDDWLALVLAREMAHVIAGHHDRNSTASIITSVLMNIILPGSQLIKSALSFAGSQLASSSGRERQIEVADEIALKMLESAGYTVKSMALNLALGPGEARLGESSWARSFVATSKTLVARVRPQPAPLQAGDTASAVAPVLASTGTLAVAAGQPAALGSEEIMIRRRPSGLPGPLILGGFRVAPRLLD